MASKAPIPGTDREVDPTNIPGVAMLLVLLTVGFTLLFLAAAAGSQIAGSAGDVLSSLVPGLNVGNTGSLPVRRVD